MCGALRDFVPFAQFKKREKHPWWSVNFSKVAGITCFNIKFQLNSNLADELFCISQKLFLEN